ncbi:MAG: hypothetical protein V8R01_08160 [Bacilli bacterium]
MSQIKTNLKKFKSLISQKIKKNSMVTNIWLFLIIFSVLILGFLWFFQIVFLDSYYEHYKTKELNNAAEELKKDYEKNNLDLLESIAMKNGICIEIYNENTNNYNEHISIKAVWNLVIEILMLKRILLEAEKTKKNTI